jgi:hypothetical protein
MRLEYVAARGVAMVLALYVGFSRLNHRRLLQREPMLVGI